MKKLLSIALTAVTLAAFAAGAQKKAGAPADNPYSDYGAAMRSAKGLPSAVQWQKTNNAAIEKAVSKETLAKLAATPGAMASLLSQVKGAYATDPVVATQIAAISQMAMCAKCPKAAKLRKDWNAALLKAAETAPDAYRAMFFLDQTRWCGEASDAAKVKAVGEKSGEKSVKDFAAMVASELAAAK